MRLTKMRAFDHTFPGPLVEEGGTLLTPALLPSALCALQNLTISLGKIVRLLLRSKVLMSVKLTSAHICRELSVRPSPLSVPTITILLDWEELTPPIPALTLTSGLLLLL